MIGEFAGKGSAVSAYPLDPESANGTGFVGMKIPKSRYMEPKDGYLITFNRG